MVRRFVFASRIADSIELTLLSSLVTGKMIKFVQIPPEAFMAAVPDGGRNYVEMFGFIEDHGCELSV